MNETYVVNNPLRVLIADDEALVRRELGHLLDEAGYAVIASASDGESALSAARRLRPDIAILDVVMQGCDGIETASILHDERIAPAILVTGHVSADIVKRAASAGVYGYLIKPARIQSLVCAIEIARQQWLVRQAACKHVADLHSAEEARSAVDVAKRILMQYRDINETEAYGLIRKVSMDSHTPMRDIAEAILAKYLLDCSFGPRRRIE